MLVVTKQQRMGFGFNSIIALITLQLRFFRFCIGQSFFVDQILVLSPYWRGYRKENHYILRNDSVLFPRNTISRCIYHPKTERSSVNILCIELLLFVHNFQSIHRILIQTCLNSPSCTNRKKPSG